MAHLPFLCFCFFRLGQKENECLLVTIKTDGSGTIIVKPDFNKGREPYRWVRHSDFSSAFNKCFIMSDWFSCFKSAKMRQVFGWGGSAGLWQEKRKRFGASLWRMRPQWWNRSRKTGSKTFTEMWVHLWHISVLIDYMKFLTFVIIMDVSFLFVAIHSTHRLLE